jgi:predicted nucleotidyltransferase
MYTTFGAIMFRDSLITTATQKVLQFLAKYSDKEFHEREIARRIAISAGSANRSLNELYKNGSLTRRQEGKMLFYSLDVSRPAVTAFKKLVNILLMEPLVEELKNITSRVIIYGSCAQGTDTYRSDMDVFIVANNRDTVRTVIENFSFPKGFEEIPLQAVIKTPVELLEAREADQVFLNEVEQGIVLWQSGMNEH